MFFVIISTGYDNIVLTKVRWRHHYNKVWKKQLDQSEDQTVFEGENLKSL